jgi:Histidinol-phosphate/aromatic aminotransferase and cobyric acid decarboxylase
MPSTPVRGGVRVIACTPLAADAIAPSLEKLDVLVVINPNNPTGERFPADTLLEWYDQLCARNGWLIVDEAFMDTTPEDSLAPYTARPGLIVLRSFGKFFGLAGLRLGFVLAEAEVLRRLREQLGPWAVNGPARWVARLALVDQAWWTETRRRLSAASQHLSELLARHGLSPAGGTALFQWVKTPEAAGIHQALASQGILTRLFTPTYTSGTYPLSLRFGLPSSEEQWLRLERGLEGGRIL